ncbi:MAG: hypothetical protein COY38_01055 [Candidatus Aenigmarchaeota archaeon CG_4_10_14_0_8_um_filter_37_24]
MHFAVASFWFFASKSPKYDCRTSSPTELERYHGTFREFDKARRGFKSDKTAMEVDNGFNMFYNFVRPHTSIGMTPSQKAGIKLELGQNRWMGLMQKSIV